MKGLRITAVLLAFALVMGMTCALAEDGLLTRAEEMAVRLDALATSEVYVSLMSGSEEISGQIAGLVAVPHDTPSAAYRVAVTMEQINAFLTAAGTDLSLIPADIRSELVKRFANSAASLINAQAGVTALAATSVLTTSTAFAAPGVTEAYVYLLEYAEAVPVMVAFCPAEDGVVTASASFLAQESPADDGFEAILRSLEEVLGELTVEEVEME